jgi:hypothetical protein
MLNICHIFEKKYCNRIVDIYLQLYDILILQVAMCNGSLKMYQSRSILGRGRVLMAEKELTGSKVGTDMAIPQPNCRGLNQMPMLCLDLDSSAK